MSEDNTGDPLDHPDVHRLFGMANELINESDRGAILICAEQVNDQLEDLFNKAAPPSMPEGNVKDILRRGPLKYLQPRNQVAAITGLIGTDLNYSIDQLRVLRNKAAHGTNPFRLRDHLDKIHAIYNLGEGVPRFINELAVHTILHSNVSRMLDLRVDIGNGEEARFKHPSDAIEWMRNNPEIMEAQGDWGPRLELGIATAMICALIIAYRDEAIERSRKDLLD